ncbi:YidB family protein [Roseateles sp. BYS180W]|uniref:YidB family protein n=1 Tax=Roseateles rivi TaxID=3299028 RepID=A0ABW7FYY0_9BURK
MGLFDAIAGQVLGSIAGNGQGSGLMEAVSGLLANHPGGLQGLVSAFEQQGLGGVVSSWIGTGQNLPISAEQIQSVLGSGQIQSLAQSLGFSAQDVSGQLAQLLPQVIDQITPNGALPEGGALEGLLGMLKG